MAKYLIHSCNERLWYVDDILIPSMVEQGIDKGDITVYNDTNYMGNLEAFVDSLTLLKEDLWHIQDDVVISKQFKRWTEEYDRGIVCGFCNLYSERFTLGEVKTKEMWYSFQCMRIPYDIAKEFTSWFYKNQKENREFAEWVKTKHDDYIFHRFMENHYPDETVLNLAPNIVDHIDYLLGGSIINTKRGDLNVRSIYWDEDDVITDLRNKLKEIKHE